MTQRTFTLLNALNCQGYTNSETGFVSDTTTDFFGCKTIQFFLNKTEFGYIAIMQEIGFWAMSETPLINFNTIEECTAFIDCDAAKLQVDDLAKMAHAFRPANIHARNGFMDYPVIGHHPKFETL